MNYFIYAFLPFEMKFKVPIKVLGNAEDMATTILYTVFTNTYMLHTIV